MENAFKNIVSFVFFPWYGSNSSNRVEKPRRYRSFSTGFCKIEQRITRHSRVTKNLSRTPDKRLLLISCSGSVPYECFEQFIPDFKAHHAVLFVSASKLTASALSHAKENFAEVIELNKYLKGGQIEMLAHKLQKIHKFTHLLALIEPEILIAGRIRDSLHLFGQGYDSSIAFRDKLRMKEVLQTRGVRVPKFKRIENATDLIEFADSNGFPIVVKPTRQMASIGATVIRDIKALEETLLNQDIFDDFHRASYEAEEFIEGEMHHIDGVVYQGKLVACWPSLELTQCVELQNGVPLFAYQLETENPRTQKLIMLILY